jgi:glycerate 2-kinase
MPEDIISDLNSPHFHAVNPILQAALESVDPYQCTLQNIVVKERELRIGKAQYNLVDFDHIYLIGTGKAVLPMALAVGDRLSNRIKGGVLIGKHDNPELQRKLAPGIRYFKGGHPIPSQQSLESTCSLVEFLKILTVKDLIICLISGGGSALMSMPYEPITLNDMQETTRLLLFSGATINEVNTLRKHLDRIKGGGLARLVEPATLATLVLSDVIGDALDAIASGPTVADQSTFQDAMRIISQYQLEDKLPRTVLDHIRKGLIGEEEESVKEGESCLERSSATIIGSLMIAAEAARIKALEGGFRAEILNTDLQGEARETGRELALRLRRLTEEVGQNEQSTCLIAGGETTVTVHGSGKGGRNQETALSAAINLEGISDCLFVSLATDGEDGPTDAAGSVVDGHTIEKGRQAGLNAEDYLNQNDAYHFLEKTSSLIKTGPTGTNVNDLVFMFAFRPE